MRNQMYPPPPPPCGKSSLTLRKHLRRFIFAAAVLFILAACEPPAPPVKPPPAAVETLTFESPTVRKSKMLVAANGSADQTYTNRLLIKSARNPQGAPVTSGAEYSITEKPTGITNEITVNPTTGQVSFGKPLYDYMTPSITDPAVGPQTVTVQAAYQGKTANYTFTVTDHFSPEDVSHIGGAGQRHIRYCWTDSTA